MQIFADRVDAGRQLVGCLGHLQGLPVAVLGLPRGGVPVAAQVATALQAPLDVIVVRKLGIPSQPELAMGAIAEDGVEFLDEAVLRVSRVRPEELHEVEEREQALLSAQVTRLHGVRPPIDLTGLVAVVVDDGLATGSTARAACLVARRRGASRVVLGIPVAPAEARGRVPEADELVVVSTVERFTAVSLHYRNFIPATDEEVVSLLEAARRRQQDPPPADREQA
jgi:putative phosphoribosyl transferase